jgi:hypothetical protein
MFCLLIIYWSKVYGKKSKISLVILFVPSRIFMNHKNVSFEFIKFMAGIGNCFFIIVSLHYAFWPTPSSFEEFYSPKQFFSQGICKHSLALDGPM